MVLWDIASGRAVHTLRGHTAPVNSVAFAPDGRSVASASADHTVRLWDAGSGSELRTLSGHHDAVTAVAFAPDGHMLASGSLDKSIKLWDAATGHEVRTLNGHTDRVSALSFCPVGQVLASASWDHSVKLWDPGAGHELRTLRGHTSEVWSVACSADGRTVASGGYDHQIMLWDAASGRQLRAFAADPQRVEAVAFAPDGRALASGGADHAVRLWALPGGTLQSSLEGRADYVKSVAFSPNGKLIVSGSADRAVRLWLAANGSELRTIPAHDSWVGAALITPDGHQVLSRGGDGTIRQWDILSGKKLRTFQAGNAHAGSASIAISPDGHTLAAGSANNQVKLWNLADGSELRTLAGHSAAVTTVAFSPDGALLASGDEHGTIKLWTVASGHEAHTLSGHTSWIGAVAFSGDGRLLASAGGDKSVRLWDVGSGQQVRSLTGHASPVTSLAFDPKEALLASADEGATIKIWNVTSGQQQHSLRGHTDLVESVAFSPDGRLLASAGEDSTIRLWDVASGSERLRLIAFRDGSFLRITPQGYYDSQGDSAEEYLNVRVGTEVSPISAYREKFYRPDLVRMALTGQKLPDTLPTLASVKPAPDVVLIDPPADSDSEALDLHVKIADRGGGIGDVRVLLNGSAVAETAGRALEVVPVAGGAPTRTVHLKLVSGNNDIQVLAFNSDNSVHSNPARATVTAKFAVPPQPPQLYALVVGIQSFQNTTLNLKYSVADATAIAQLLQQKAAALYKVNIQTLTDQKATTKTAIEDAFARYKNISPGDVFVFYVATHGAIIGADLASREYFLIPSNVNTLTEEAVRHDAFSDAELKQLIAGIPATRKLLLLDTCHAGAMGDAMMVTTRDLQESGAVAVLSGAVGSTVLSASTSDEEALEGENGHGLFTFVLLQGLGGSADFRKNGYIKTFDLADYVDDEVPKIADEHFHRKQVPNLHNAGQSFQIVSSR